MPALKVCNEKGCGRFFDPRQAKWRRCPEHDAAYAQWKDARRRQRRQLHRAVYNAPAWQKLRLAVFYRDEFTCQLCGLESPGGTGLVCDHVDGIRNGDPFDIDRLQTLCARCSGIKDGPRGAPAKQTGGSPYPGPNRP